VLAAPLAALLLAAASAAAAPVWHPDSLSSSHVTVRGSQARLLLRCQVLSLLEVVPGLDADRDGRVTADEAHARHADIADYVGEHYRLLVGTDRDLEGGTRLEPVAGGLRHAPADGVRDDGIGYREGAVDVELLFHAEDEIHDVMIESSLFLATSPDHVDLATVEWIADDGTTVAARSFGLEARAPRARFDPEGRGAALVFVRLGWRHILTGWDHLAFLAALVLASRRLTSLLGVVTAFTLAHSVTLAIASLGVVDTAPYARFIEAAIALSIAYVAADNLLPPHLRRSRGIEAFAFGLVHGLGFAGFLARSLVAEPSKTTALLAFNVGVELGQIVVVVGLVLLLRLLPRRGEREVDPFLAPALVRRTGSAVVAILGLGWFLTRI